MGPRTIYLIKRAEIEVTSRMSRVLGKFNLTPIQFVVLYFVNIDKGDLSSAQLSRRFSMTPQSMSELVAVLQKKRLVKKTVDVAHKRILRISLTTKGTQLLSNCNEAIDSLEKELFGNLSSREVEMLRGALAIILDQHE